MDQVLKCSVCGCFRRGTITCGSYLCETCTDQHLHPFSSQLQRNKAPCDPSAMDLMTTPRSKAKRRSAKQHQCSECGKIYKHLGTLSVHKKMHAGEFNFKCEYCDKEFYLAEYYNRHLRVHTKEKPYQCDVCNKSFSQSNTLTQHKRIHTGLTTFHPLKVKTNSVRFAGEKPYECNICNKNFSVKDYLVKHIRYARKLAQHSNCETIYLLFHFSTGHTPERSRSSAKCVARGIRSGAA